ncbi:MAG: SGNH/GDSL hydrolase family protein [Paludibacter sp.]|nr:SGNH/GDSL hydrolase family protein [Paludibacter sp.]
MKNTIEIKFVILLLIFSFSVNSRAEKTSVQKIACVGNSITYGYGLSSPSTQCYPTQLQVLFGTTNWQVGNFGVSSRTLLKRGDKPYWNESAYTNAKTFLPNKVMILLGTNDAKNTNWNPYGKEFVSNYKEMIDVFRNLSSKPEIYIGLIPPGENVVWTISFNYIKDSVNTHIKQVALESGVNLIDIFDGLNGNSSNWFNSTLFQSDGIHPKTAGAAIIAQKVKELMTIPSPELEYTNSKISAPNAYDYQWYYNDIPIAEYEGGKNAELVPLKIGKYKVSIKLNETNETRIVSEELEISELSLGVKNQYYRDINVFPNPTNDGNFQIEIPSSDNFLISIYDLSGKTCLQNKVLKSFEKLNVSGLAPGNYLLKIYTNDFVFYSKLLKII